MAEFGQLLLALYGASHGVPPEAFQDTVLNLLKPAVPFDSAIWGTGIMTPQGLVYHSIHLHNAPPEIIAAHEHVKHQETASFEAWPHAATTKTFHSPTLFRDREKSAVRNCVRRFSHQKLIVCSEINQESNYAHWVSLYRADADQPYTAREQQVAGLIVPHLREALRINRVLHMARLRGMHGDGAMAIVDAKGALFHSERGFAALLRAEWSAWNGSLLPKGLWDALVAGEGRYAGKAIVVRRICVTDMMYLKARRRSAVDALSARERTVARRVAQGLSHKEIARMLGTAPQTVRNQIHAIHGKLGIHNRAELIAQLNLAA